jgi:hypothetical protein
MYIFHVRCARISCLCRSTWGQQGNHARPAAAIRQKNSVRAIGLKHTNRSNTWKTMISNGTLNNIIE